MINTYNESDLHKSLKMHYCPKDGKMEQEFLGSICDIVCRDGKIIEIQTSNLGALKHKLTKFLQHTKVEIVYPIAVNSYINMLNIDGSTKYKRKSPKHGSFFQIFKEAAALINFIHNPNLNIIIVYIENEIIKNIGKSVNKRKRHTNTPNIINKKLIKIEKEEVYKPLNKICTKVLNLLPNEFTNDDIRKIAPQIYSSYTSWFLRKTGYIKNIGKMGKFILYKKV